MKLGSRRVEVEKDLYFIADIGANHDGSLDRALELINLCAEAGANAAKFQHFSAETIVSDAGFKALGSQKGHQSKWSKSVYEVYADASINAEWTEDLKKECVKAGIDFFTSPYSFKHVDDIDAYVDLYKIGSGDITWTALIEYIAARMKPVLLATGASSLEDVRRAVSSIQGLNSNLILMQCNTNYTGSVDNFRYLNLEVLNSFKKEFPGVILGLSDHTPGHSSVLGALALGATVFEKHFTDDNGRNGPDHGFAMNPESWKRMVEAANELWLAIGDGKKVVEENEFDTVVLQRRALRASSSLMAGSVIEKKDIVALRPCPHGSIEPYREGELIGRTLKHDISDGEAFNWEMVE